MGWSLNSVLVAGLPAEQVAARLGYVIGGGRVHGDEATAGSRAQGPSIAPGPGGAVVVVDPLMELAALDGTGLSAGGVTVHQVIVEEHVSVSAASCWTDGALRWSLVHQAEEDLFDLQVTGTPPAALDALRQAAEQQTRDGGVDAVFEVPVDLVAAETGFRYDVLPLEREPSFRPLVPGPAAAATPAPPPAPASAPPPAPPRRRWFRRN